MRLWTIAAALLLLLTPIAAWSQMPQPANSQIKSVYGDLDRFEQQAAGANNASGAKRIMRLLKLTEQRLQGAPDQGDPSWQAAAARLTALQQRLNDIAAGKPAASAPAAASPTVQSPPALQAAPAIVDSDPVVAAAMQEIARISDLVDRMAPGDKVAGRQYVNELTAVSRTLRGVSKKDQAWSEAARSFNALQNRVVALANAPATGAPATAAPSGTSGSGSAPAGQTAKADPNVDKALRELKFNARNVEQMRGGSIKMEQRVLGDLNRIGDLLAQVADKSHPSWQQAHDEWQSQLDTVAQRRLTAIAAQLEKLGEQIGGLDPVALVNEQAMAPFQRSLDDLARQMAVYDAYISKPGYSDTWDTHTRVSGLFTDRVAKAEAAEAKLGDVAANVALIEQRMRETPVPQALSEFTSEEAALTYAQTMKLAHAQSVQAAAYLQKIDGKTDKVDKQTIQRLKHWAGQDRLKQIDQSLTQTRQQLAGRWAVYQSALDFRATDDPTDVNHQANRFLMEGRYEENRKTLEDGLAFLAVADAYEKAVGIDNGAARLQQKAALSNAIATYEENYRVALSSVRMRAGIDDDDLREIATATLKKPSYGVNLPWRRLEVGKKTHRKQATTSVSGSTLVTDIFEWDEFQARTVEKVGDKWYIFVNDLKYFQSGGTTTPLDRWLVAKRWQSNQILEENIDK